MASCLALRAVLRAAHENRPPVRTHLERLLAIRVPDPHLAFVVVGAVGMAPPEYHPRVASLVMEIGGRQGEDGTWPEVTMFHAVDMLLSAPSPAAQALVRKASPHVAGLQRASGTFDDGAGEDLALIALRALDAARTMA